LEVDAMASLTAPRPSVNPNRQRKPLTPVSVVGRFIGGATMPDLLTGAAVLEIEGDQCGQLEMVPYWCQAVTDHGEVVAYRLLKFGSAEAYTLPSTVDGCDCADGTYRGERPGGCRHQQALRQALANRTSDLPPGVDDNTPLRDDDDAALDAARCTPAEEVIRLLGE
jgi:hypothetical protein